MKYYIILFLLFSPLFVFSQIFGGSIVKKSVSSVGSISTLNCGGVTQNGNLNAGNFGSITISISYTGGNGGSYATQSITSTGITGLTATLSSGTLNSGVGSVSLTVSGTASAAGNANFAITFAGVTCNFTVIVGNTLVIPSSIVLNQDITKTFISVNDNNYLPFSTPTGTATTNVSSPDGTNEILVNILGTITTAGTSIRIPVTATGIGTLPAYSAVNSVPSSLSSDGISRNLKLSWSSQNFNSTTKFITATLQSIVGNFNIKQLDINEGFGINFAGVLLTNFVYPYNNAGNLTNLEVRVVPVLPDKRFGLPDNSGDSSTHRFLYVPIKAADGKIWLNNDLGANYSNLNSAVFNPLIQGTNSTDFNAYGSLFQWGRFPDGHELITWTGSTSGTPKYGNTQTKSDNPTHSLFIREVNAIENDWRVNANPNLWNSESATNNPCPSGFRVPTMSELNQLTTAEGIFDNTTNSASSIKFGYAGFRRASNASLLDVGNYVDLNTSVNGNLVEITASTYINITTSDLMSGSSIRCIKN